MINQEEYEILKKCDDEFKWVARDKNRKLWAYTKKPDKGVHSWGRVVNVDFLPRHSKDLFQFIQWKDEEPYNIAELIEEYDKSQAYEIIESEEAEVKKDIEWLKGRFSGRKIFKPQNDREIGYNMAIDEFSEYVDQLDEPEVLSEEWIENKKWQAYDPDARTLYSAVTETDLENLLVPKQELPVIPKYVADWIEGNKQSEEKWSDYDKEDAMNDTIHFTIYGLFADYPATNSHVELRNPVLKWLSVDRGNYFKLVNAVRYGYEVEEEPLYRARLKVITDKFIASYLRTQSSDTKYRLKALEIGSKYIHEDHRHLSEFTENELKRLGIWGSEQWEVEELGVEGEEDER